MPSAKERDFCKHIASKHGIASFFEPHPNEHGRKTLTALRSILERLIKESACDEFLDINSKSPECSEITFHNDAEMAQHLRQIIDFYQRAKTQVPDLVIEFAKLRVGQNYVEFGPPMPGPPMPPAVLGISRATFDYYALPFIGVLLGLAACAAGLFISCSSIGSFTRSAPLKPVKPVKPLDSLIDEDSSKTSSEDQHLSGFYSIGILESLFAGASFQAPLFKSEWAPVPSKSAYSSEERSSSAIGGFNIYNIFSTNKAEDKPQARPPPVKTYARMAKDRLKSQYALLKDIQTS